MKIFTLLICFTLFSSTVGNDTTTVKLALLKYRGGGDWYANPTSLSNLAEFCNQKMGMNLDPDYATVEVGSPDIFNYPIVHMTGHGNVVFNDKEAENLRTYLLGGGFLHIDDNYGMDPFVRPAIAMVFPNKELVEVPFSHPIYSTQYNFTQGPPKIHEHDNKVAQGFGIIHEGRLVLYYTYESDLGDGWEDQEVHNDPQEVRLKALRMGANIVKYAMMN